MLFNSGFVGTVLCWWDLVIFHAVRVSDTQHTYSLATCAAAAGMCIGSVAGLLDSAAAIACSIATSVARTADAHTTSVST